MYIPIGVLHGAKKDDNQGSKMEDETSEHEGLGYG
jgi:hypothetical protein